MSKYLVPFWEKRQDEISIELNDNIKEFYNKPGIIHAMISGDLFQTVANQAASLARWMRHTHKKPTDIGSVIEFGGGFGSMCQTLLPFISGDYTIIDLPPLIRLQEWYLRKTKIANVAWIDSTQIDEYPQLNCDMFIAVYSLSEAGEYLIRKVIDSKFFGAKHILFVFYNKKCDDFIFDQFIPELKQFGELIDIDENTQALFR